MLKIDTHIVISNYFTDPEYYVNLTNNYTIYDQTTDAEIAKLIQIKYPEVVQTMNTGHNISDYLKFIIENYDDLPEWMMFAKGNMVGRHITLDYFERVYKNKIYTNLFHEENLIDKQDLAYYLFEGAYIERNNSWYMNTKEHNYVHTYNQMLSLIYKKPIYPEYIIFSPGCCAILSKNNILINTKEMYINLKKLVSYKYFPAEAYIIERMFHTLMHSKAEKNELINNVENFNEYIEEINQKKK